jgi:hypothetical protein
MGKNRNKNATKIDENESQMKFTLFQEISFKINNPLTLIEACCIQSNFYRNYDLILAGRNRMIEDVNRIGARGRFSMQRVRQTINNVINDLPLLRHTLDTFLNLQQQTRNRYIENLASLIEALDNIDGIYISTATKICHTLYPEIIPIIDNLLLA